MRTRSAFANSDAEKPVRLSWNVATWTVGARGAGGDAGGTGAAGAVAVVEDCRPRRDVPADGGALGVHAVLRRYTVRSFKALRVTVPPAVPLLR